MRNGEEYKMKRMMQMEGKVLLFIVYDGVGGKQSEMTILPLHVACNDGYLLSP